MTGSRWRLLIDGPSDGAWNMAVDEAVSEAVGRGEAAPTLRFYAWEHPTISLGALQRFPGGVDVTACRRHGIPLVRRMSGGRAVLHEAELTYSVAVPRTGVWQGSVPEVFRRLCEGLVAGLVRLGIGAALGDGRPSPGRPEEGACFLLRQAPAILAGSRKLLGSAQYRSDRAVLQQGSLLLDFDSSLHVALFPAWPRRHPAAAVTCLRELLGRMPTWESVVAALCQGWQERVGPVGVKEVLTSAESTRATHLVRIRYGTEAWTRERRVAAGAGESEGRDDREPWPGAIR
jgi:lipoate-protein ligase A